MSTVRTAIPSKRRGFYDDRSEQNEQERDREPWNNEGHRYTQRNEQWHNGGRERNYQERGYEQERDGGHRHARQGNGGHGHNEHQRQYGQERNGEHSHKRGGNKPTDARITLVALGPDGPLRKQIFAALETANLGTPPAGGLMTKTGNPRAPFDRIAKVSNWVDGHLCASAPLMKAKYSEMATSFAHLVRAITDAGLYDQLVALLTEHYTTLAVEAYQER